VSEPVTIGSRVLAPGGKHGRVLHFDVDEWWSGPKMRRERVAYATVRLDNGARERFPYGALVLEPEGDPFLLEARERVVRIRDSLRERDREGALVELNDLVTYLDRELVRLKEEADG